MFPIRDARGGITGFGGRILNPDDVPKFMNSPQSPLFDKSSLLYGLDKARKAIRNENQAVIVEGYMDVIVVHQEGFQNVVSPMGTALTEIQMRQLKRYTRSFVLALDPDAAGIKATLRGLEVARESLDHSQDLVFDARGLLHNEAVCRRTCESAPCRMSLILMRSYCATRMNGSRSLLKPSRSSFMS